MRWISAALLLAVACGTEPVPPRTIRGKATFVTRDASGAEKPFPIGLHDTFVEAQFPTGAGWDIRAGVARADGTFTLEDAPPGPYWLQLYDTTIDKKQFLWTDATTLDFVEDAIGRADAVVPTKSPTTLSFARMPGLDPVVGTDGLQFTCANLGLFTNLFGALQTGETVLDTRQGWMERPLVSAAHHDQVLLVQLRTKQDLAAGLMYTSPIASVLLDGIEQKDGEDTPVQGTFTTPPEFTYELNWKRSAFAAVKSAIHPTRAQDPRSQNFRVSAMPGGTAHGVLLPQVPLVLVLDSSLLIDTTDLRATVKLRNPYPREWLYNEFAMAFPVEVPQPGIPDATLEQVAMVGVVSDELPTADHPVTPLVTPVRAPQINGQDLFADHEGVGLTPTISWTAPAVGAPTAYLVNVNEWEGLDTGSGGLASVASLIVPGNVTSIRLPARVLEPGKQYLASIRAIQQKGQDVRVHSLYRAAMPYGYADLIGNTFAP